MEFPTQFFGGITRSQYKDPYKPISISWFMSAKGLLHAAQFPFKNTLFLQTKNIKKKLCMARFPQKHGSVFFSGDCSFPLSMFGFFFSLQKMPFLVFGGFFKVIL